MSMYEYVWLSALATMHCNDQINNLCVSWRESLPYNTHCYLLSLLSRCLPLFDEICRRSLKFINDCLANGSNLIRAVANDGLQYDMQNSFLGRNMSFCACRYNCRYYDICYGNINTKRTIDKHVDNL